MLPGSVVLAPKELVEYFFLVGVANTYAGVANAE